MVIHMPEILYVKVPNLSLRVNKYSLINIFVYFKFIIRFKI